MAERAAPLVDHVFPAVPVRQWVLTLPHALRYRLAWDHALCRDVVAVAVRTILGFLRHAAREAGVEDGRGGAVALIQRFGGALNLNVHVHALVIDGVLTRSGAGVRFWPAPLLTDIDVAEVLATIVPRTRAMLEPRGLGTDAGGVDGWEAEEPVLAGLAAASVQGRFALGSRVGRGVRRCGVVREPVGGSPSAQDHAHQDGFDLHAAVRVSAHDRDRLERLCRYALRPPVAQERLRLTPEGQVLLELKRPWSDGTSHLLFDPVEFLERLAVLIPRPRINLILYHGVLGPRAKWRPLVVRLGRCAPRSETGTGVSLASDASSLRPDTRLWADLMRRTFGIDTLVCPRCGGRLRLIALIEAASVIERILRHLGLPTAVPSAHPGRAPPLLVSASCNGDTATPAFLPRH